MLIILLLGEEIGKEAVVVAAVNLVGGLKHLLKFARTEKLCRSYDDDGTIERARASNAFPDGTS